MATAGSDAEQEPQHQPFDPKRNEPPPEIQEWGNTTTIGIIAGMLYGGIKETIATSPAREAVFPDPNVNRPGEEQPTAKSIRSLVRDRMEKRMLRIARGSVIGGSQLGLLTAIFSGTQLSLAKYREKTDAWNTVMAGTVTGGTFGLTISGSIVSKVQSCLFGSIVGGILSFPLGLAHASLQSLLPSENVTPSKKTSQDPSSASTDVTPSSGISNTIQHLERRLEERVALIESTIKKENQKQQKQDE